MDCWQYIVNSLKDSKAVYLLYVVHSEGSSPGRTAFKMAVADDGTFNGTIGGGVMEFKLVEKARNLLEQKTYTPFLQEQYHDKVHPKNQSGMICSGSQTIAFMPLLAKDIALIETIIAADNNAAITITSQGIALTQIAKQELVYHSETDWRYTGPIKDLPVIHIIGGGHCGLALSQLMKQLSFYIHLYDDRENLNTIDDNHFADEMHLVDYAQIGETIAANPADFVVIMTIGYRTDKIVLTQLIHKTYRYLGLLGSVQKIATLFEELKAEGIPNAQLSAVHAPIGLNINSKTTQEIAVSIAAEVIKIKNG
jgi:xanthine dehydrogenase accessory factor